MRLDRHYHGAMSWIWDSGDAECCFAELADRLVDGLLAEEIWGGWPLCPRHATRPMWARFNAGRAVWVCEADQGDVVEIGRLATFA